MAGIIVLEGLPSLPLLYSFQFSLTYIKLSKALVSGESYDVVYPCQDLYEPNDLMTRGELRRACSRGKCNSSRDMWRLLIMASVK
jgi:hypothetical protein